MATRPAQMVLAGDIGGTNARLRLCDRTGRRIVDEVVLSSTRARSLAALLGNYLARRKVRVAAAALGIAGPVIDGVVKTTNLPWTIDERKLARELGIPKLVIVNDLAAGAIGCLHAKASSQRILAPGRPPRDGNMAVLAAGTGLGEAVLVAYGGTHVPSATEGGHATFAPQSDLEFELAAFLRRSHRDHISYERVLSGPGLGKVYDFFVERHGDESAEVKRLLARADRNATITSLGLSGKSRAAADAVDLFARVYGAEAGNLVLKSFALKGVFLFGAIATTIFPRKKDAFLLGMRRKGRMSALLSRVPVTLVDDRFVGLTGAGYLAARLMAE